MVKPLKPRGPIRQADNVSLVDQLTAVHLDGSRLGHGKLEIKPMLSSTPGNGKIDWCLCGLLGGEMATDMPVHRHHMTRL